MSAGGVPPAVRELQATETSFSEALHTMLDVYHKPLRDAQYKLAPLLHEREIDEIFGNVEDLLIIADELKRALDKRIDEAQRDPAAPAPKVSFCAHTHSCVSCGSIGRRIEPWAAWRSQAAAELQWRTADQPQRRGAGPSPRRAGDDVGARAQVGDILTNFAGIFRLFERYIIHYERGATRLAACKERERGFAQFLERQQAAAPGTLPLEAYLIMPVQVHKPPPPPPAGAHTFMKDSFDPDGVSNLREDKKTEPPRGAAADPALPVAARTDHRAHAARLRGAPPRRAVPGSGRARCCSVVSQRAACLSHCFSVVSQDLSDLHTARAAVEERAVQCNEATRRRENTEALRRIQVLRPVVAAPLFLLDLHRSGLLPRRVLCRFHAARPAAEHVPAQGKLQGVEVVGASRVLLCEGTLLRVRARMDPKDYLFLLFNDALVYAGSSPPPSPARLLYGGGCLSGQTWSNRCIKAARAHEPLHALSPRRPRRAPRRLLARALPP